MKGSERVTCYDPGQEEKHQDNKDTPTTAYAAIVVHHGANEHTDKYKSDNKSGNTKNYKEDANPGLLGAVEVIPCGKRLPIM